MANRKMTMEPVYISYKYLEADENNIFTANISEKNEEENVVFRNSQEYGVTGIIIKRNIDDSSIVKVIDEKKT